MFEQRKRSQHQPGVATQIWSVVDLDRVHMHMKVSDLLGNVWAPSVAVHTVSSAPAAKWSAEELDGKFCLDRSWIFVDSHFKEPLVQALAPLLTHPVAPAPHYRMLFICVHMDTNILFSSGISLQVGAYEPSFALNGHERVSNQGYVTVSFSSVSNLFTPLDVVFLRVGQKDMVFSEKELAFLSKVHTKCCA